PEASVLVNARPDVARAVGAQGVQLGRDDLAPAEARAVLGPGWIGASVHSIAEAEAAAAEGADFLLVGAIYPTASHPGRAPAGIGLVRAAAALGKPVIAIGGVTAERTAELRDAGAYGAAAIRALWSADDPARAALALLAPWMDEA
ncbi:MAG TPA: thiamine phosphate synthase, partial [Gemmatimonadales bacterium]|nr:thiamine phosphate synthase [Gemmatimonadales bacterium]